MLVCKAYICARIRDKKTHVYRVAGMIASIRGKKPHVYRVIILKQMADHKFLTMNRSLFRSAFVKQRTQSLKRQSTDSNKSVVGEPTTTTTVRAMNKDLIPGPNLARNQRGHCDHA